MGREEHAIKIIITHIDTTFGKFRYYSVLDQSFHMDGQSDRGTLFYRLCLSRLLLPVTFIFGLHKVNTPCDRKLTNRVLNALNQAVLIFIRPSVSFLSHLRSISNRAEDLFKLLKH